MATLSVMGVFSYGTPFDTSVLVPGASRSIRWGPSDAFKNAGVILTPHPRTRGVLADMSMKVSDLQSYTVTTPLGSAPSGGLSTTEYYVGATFTNAGSTPISAFDVTVSIITPGPDGH